MTDTASAAPSEREQFEAHVKAYTGRDIEYHERNGTTGLEFGWACWQVARAQPTQAQAGAVPLTDEQIVEASCVYWGKAQLRNAFEAGARFAERHHGIKGGQHGTE